MQQLKSQSPPDKSISCVVHIGRPTTWHAISAALKVLPLEFSLDGSLHAVHNILQPILHRALTDTVAGKAHNLTFTTVHSNGSLHHTHQDLPCNCASDVRPGPTEMVK